MSVGSMGSSLLSADLLSFLTSSQLSSGITPHSAAGEVTTQAKDGSSVTTIGQGPNANVVADTSAHGTTATEVGYVSPVLLQNFLDSLQQALQGAGTGRDGDAPAALSNAPTAASVGVSANTEPGLASSLQTLIKQLDAGRPVGAPSGRLLTAFSGLLQGSGINPSAAGATDGGAGGALQAFLAQALSELKASGSSSVGSNFNVSS
jgi:hypothetical protein